MPSPGSKPIFSDERCLAAVDIMREPTRKAMMVKRLVHESSEED